MKGIQIKEILNKDITLKIISGLIAVILWLYVVNVQNPEKEVTLKDIPIAITGTEFIDEAGLFMLSEVADTVTLKIKGKTKDLAGLNEQSFKAIADLRGLNRTGDHSVSIQLDSAVEGITILERKPYYINVKLDKIMEIQKTVEVVPKGMVKEPYMTFAPQVTPNIVSLRGPSTIISTIDSLKVSVDLTGQTKNVIAKPKYEIYNKAGEKITSTHIVREVDTVQVVYPIMKVKEVAVTPQLTGSLAENYLIAKTEVIPSIIKIAGKDEIVDGINQVFTDSIDINNFDEDMDVEVPLIVPEGLKLVDPINTARVMLDIERQISRSFNIQSIRVDNVPENSSYSLITKQVEIAVRGMESIVNGLEVNNIYASIDIKGLSEGQHEVPLNIRTFSDVEVMGNHTVMVRVSKQKNDGESTPASNTTEQQSNTQSSGNQDSNTQDGTAKSEDSEADD
ncbi:MAG: YbbR-like domain-containing protein [Clostridia bacterium]